MRQELILAQPTLRVYREDARLVGEFDFYGMELSAEYWQAKELLRLTPVQFRKRGWVDEVHGDIQLVRGNDGKLRGAWEYAVDMWNVELAAMTGRPFEGETTDPKALLYATVTFTRKKYQT